MKIRVCYTTEVDDRYRRAIRHYYGETGLASRKEVQNWLRTYGSSCDADVLDDLDKADKASGNQRGKGE